MVRQTVSPMILLFIIAVVVFAYLVYAIAKPEKF